MDANLCAGGDVNVKRQTWHALAFANVAVIAKNNFIGVYKVYLHWQSQPEIWSCKCKFFSVYRPYKESISKEMNKDRDLNLHLHDQMSDWLRYCIYVIFLIQRITNGDRQ